MGSSATQSAAPQLAVTSVKIEKDKLDRFREIARANRRSISQELRWLIDQRIAETDAGREPPTT